MIDNEEPKLVDFDPKYRHYDGIASWEEIVPGTVEVAYFRYQRNRYDDDRPAELVRQVVLKVKIPTEAFLAMINSVVENGGLALPAPDAKLAAARLTIDPFASH